MNRFSDYTPSVYNPMTFEEIAMVPMMKRKQHDETLAKQELIRAGLAKVDPLKEHFDEALQLKQGIESQMDNTALELSRNGINNDMIGKTIALNRQYQDMVSPTGKIGQINAAKTIYNKEKEDFIKYAESQKIGKEIAEQRWKEKTSDYTGFDKDNKIINVSPQGVAAFQDYGQDLSRAHSILGETIKGLPQNVGYGLVDSGQGDGSTFMVNTDGQRIRSNNAKQVESAYKSFRDKWIAENGEGTKYSKDAGLGIDEARILNDFNSMLKSSDVTKLSQSASYNSPKEGKDESIGNPSVITEDVKQQDKTRQDLDEFKNFAEGNLTKTPTPPKNLSHMTKDQQQVYYNSVKEAKRKYLVTNSNDPVEMKKRFDENFSAEQKVKYLNSYNALVAQGKIKKDANPYVKSSSDLIKKDWMRRASVEFSNQIIDVDSMDNDVLASPSLVKKTSEQRNGFIQKRLANAIGNKQDIVFDPETGRKIDMSEVKLTDVNLIGHYAPLNKLAKIGESEDNSVSPYKISWVDSEGKIKTGLMTRDASEIGKPEFRGAKLIKKTTDAAVDNEGNYTSFNIYNTPELNNIDTSVFGESVKDLGKISGMRVKYDFKTNSYNIELVNSKNKSKKLNNVDPQTYQNIIYDMTN